MNLFSNSKILGIIGGGQLGKMLLNDTFKWNIKTYVLDPDKDAPAKQFCNKFFCGDLNDYDTIYQFGKKVDVITFEIEHINTEALIKLEEEGVIIYPKPNTLNIIQDKFKQKKFYLDNNIPTSDFIFFDRKKDIYHALETKKIKLPFVWKSTKFGYDGFGVKIINSKADIELIENKPCIIEELIDYKKELSLIICRNLDGDYKLFPTVEMEFNKISNQLETVIFPAEINDKINSEVRKVALKVADSFKNVGLLAIEMFLTTDNQILVNEVAPRPHNSGHFTIEGTMTSQFEQHIRAILNLPLGSTKLICAGLMMNLSGSENFSGNVHYENLDKIFKLEGVNLHVYGKKKIRPNRKMGHITILNKNKSKAEEIKNKIKKTIKIISK